MTDVIPLNETKQTDTKQESVSAPLGMSQFTRTLIPVGTALVGRSVKMRDKFIVSGAVSVNSSTVTVANTTTETDIGSFRFFANEWHVGMVVRITGFGVYSTANAADTFSVRIGLGLAPTTAMATLSSAGASVTNAGFHFEFYGRVSAIGASGTIVPSLSGDVNDSSRDSIATSATALNTTTTQTIGVTAQWSNNLAGNTLTLETLVFEVLN